MKKISIVLLVFCFLWGLIPQALAQEKTFPQSDFYLYLGVRKASPESSFGPILERILFNSVQVEVKSGKVMANQTIPYSMTRGNQDHQGNATLIMTGDYDKTDGQLSGSFDIKYDMNDVWHGGVKDQEGKSNNMISGTFNGQVVDDKVVIRYKGTFTSVGWTERALDVQNFNYSDPYSVTVVWRQSGYNAIAPAAEPVNNDFLDANGNTVDSGARFSGFTGQVEIHLPGTPEDAWTAAEMEMVLPVGTRIRTKEESTMTLGFNDMSTFTLNPESQIIISKPPGKESKLALVAGNILVNAKKILTEGTMEIDMAQAAASIKGTTFTCSQIGDVSTVKVIEGQVLVKAKTGEQTANLTGGQAALVDSAGKIDYQSFEVIDELNSWDNGDQLDFAQFEQKLPITEDINYGEPIYEFGSEKPPIIKIILKIIIAIIIVVLVITIGIYILKKKK